MDVLDQIALSGAETALVVIDVVNDFCDAGFRYAQEGWDINPMKKMVDLVLLDFIQRSKEKIPIAYVKSEYSPRQFEDDPHPIRNLCVLGTKGAEFYKLNPEDDDIVFIKNHWSALLEYPSSNPTEFQTQLRARNIEKLIITGVTTSHCIPINIEHALRMGYGVILPRDCVASRAERIEGPRGHKEVIAGYERHPKVQVVDSAGIRYM